MTQRNVDAFREVKAMTSEIADAFEIFKETHDEKLAEVKRENAQLRDRLEELEAKGGQPGRAANPAPQRRWREYRVGEETVFELPADVKLAEAIPAKPAPITLDRWVAAALLGEACKDREAVEYVRDTKSLATTTSGALVPVEYISQWIDAMRSRLVLNAAGITTTTMAAKTETRSRLLTDPTVAWRAEGGTLTPSDPTFELRNLVAKSAYVRVQGTVEASADIPDFGRQLIDVMGNALALAIDRAGLTGTGGTQPQGVIGTSGVNVVTGAALTNYDKFFDMVGALLNANVSEADVGPICTGTRVLTVLRKLKTGITSDQTQLPVPQGLPRFLPTTSLQSTGSPVSSQAIVGNWSDLLLGVRREASIETLKLDTYASSLLLEFVGWLRVDFLVRRPAAFTTMTSIPH